MTSKETAGREGKGEDGRVRTREVKMAVFFTQDKLDEDGYPVRDRASSTYIATFEPGAAFQRLVRTEGIPRGAEPRRSGPSRSYPSRASRGDIITGSVRVSRPVAGRLFA